MFAILRGANGRRHEVDFGEDPVTIDVAMSATTVQITMTAADPGDPAKAASSPLRSHVTPLPPPWRLPPRAQPQTANSSCGSFKRTDNKTSRSPSLLPLLLAEGASGEVFRTLQLVDSGRRRRECLP